MPIYDIDGNLIYNEGRGVEFNNAQADSVYGLMFKTAFLSNIDKEKSDFEQSFYLARNNLYPLENVDADFMNGDTGRSFHARITRGYHVSLEFYQDDSSNTNYVVSFARMDTYKNQFDNLPSMYTFPSGSQIEIGVSNVVSDGINSIAIRNRLANSNQNGNVRTGKIMPVNDFKNTLTLASAEPTGSFYLSADIEKANASLEFDFDLKVGNELWV